MKTKIYPYKKRNQVGYTKMFVLLTSKAAYMQIADRVANVRISNKQNKKKIKKSRIFKTQYKYFI